MYSIANNFLQFQIISNERDNIILSKITQNLIQSSILQIKFRIISTPEAKHLKVFQKI